MRRNLLQLLCLMGSMHVLGCAKTDFPESSSSPVRVARQLPEPPSNHAATPMTSDRLVPDASYPVPNMAPEELLKFIRQLGFQEPRGNTEEELLADQQSRAKSQLIAAERILGQADIPPDVRAEATKAKLDALRLLAMVDADGLGKDYPVYLQQLRSSDADRLKLLGKVSELEFDLDRVGLGQPLRPADVTKRVEEVLQSDGLERPEFLITQYAGIVLDQQGHVEQATNVFRSVADHFADSADEGLAEEARGLQRHNLFRATVLAALDGGDVERDRLFTQTQALIREQGATQESLDVVLHTAQMFEYRGRLDVARAFYGTIERAFADAEPPLADQASRAVDHAAKRLRLLGAPITVQGNQPDGTPFQWQRLEGKVVFVDFWASWSGPWHEQLPELRETYAQFHDQGFEIVGVNLDPSKDDLYRFLGQQPLPWPVIADETAGGLGNGNAAKCGVDIVPFGILVGRDGRVVAIHVQRDSLDQQVQRLLRDSGSDDVVRPQR